MVVENTRPTSQHSIGLDRYGASSWSIIFGLLAAALMGGILYVAFRGDLIDARSTAIPSPSAASGREAPTQSPVPSTR
jgi:hypothetical protein